MQFFILFITVVDFFIVKTLVVKAIIMQLNQTEYVHFLKRLVLKTGLCVKELLAFV